MKGPRAKTTELQSVSPGLRLVAMLLMVFIGQISICAKNAFICATLYFLYKWNKIKYENIIINEYVLLNFKTMIYAHMKYEKNNKEYSLLNFKTI